MNILRVIIKDESAKLLLPPPLLLLYCAWPMPDPRLFAAPRAGKEPRISVRGGRYRTNTPSLGRMFVRTQISSLRKKPPLVSQDQAARSLNAGQSSESIQRESGKALL